MKESKRKYLLLVGMIIIASLVLSGCAGGGVSMNNWPGVSVQGDTVYLSYQVIYALRVSDGTLKWQYPEKANAKNLLYSPVLALDTQALAGDYGGVLRSINTNTGTQSWTFEQSKTRYIASPITANDNILAPSTDGDLYAMNMNGALQWKFHTSAAIWVSPVSDGTSVYLASMDKKLYALQLKDGEKIWEMDMGAAAMTAPILSEDGSLVYITTLGNKVLAVNAASGSLAWEYATTDAVWSQPFLYEGKLFFGDNDGFVTSLDAATGKKIWSTDMGSPVISGGAILSTGLVFATESGDVISISPEGSKLWTRSVESQVYSNLVVSEDHVLVALTKSSQLLACFDANGNQVWTFTPGK
ncbi:MAG: PQQ-binding-like beta-propeller repeat protein [Anaerolineaceae bacterium]